MNMRSSIVVGLVVVAAFAVGMLAGRSLAPSGEEIAGPNAQPVVTAAPRDHSGPDHAFSEIRSEDAARPQAQQAEGFAFRRLFLDTGEDLPKACFLFTEPLDDSGEVNYADYVRLSPDTPNAPNVNGSSLCIAGLDFDRDYTATIRSGLPAKSGARLARSETVAVAFGDKPAFVGFVGNGVVLPRLEADGIGIETVNVDKLGIEVWRVSDRSIWRKSIVEGESAEEGVYPYVYDDENGAEDGVLVFDNEIETPGARNETISSVFALGAALDTLKPGAYFIRLTDKSASADDWRPATAWRWIMFTDMALTSFTGDGGIDVFVRSISAAKPVAGVELSLIAANNDVLGTAVTNADGQARFGAALTNGDYPLTPRMIVGYGPQEDFAALDLRRAPLDLSDRNVAGRDASSAIDGFIWMDRGIYRPGETIHLAAQFRDSAGRAIQSRPMMMRIKRPNGTVADVKRISALDIGGFALDYEVPKSAPRGRWSVTINADGEDAPVATQSFSVEDFVPQRLDVAIKVDDKTPMRPGERRPIAVESRYLYGAPAGGLPVEAEARLRLAPNPFPDFSGYRFGLSETRFTERLIDLGKGTTGADGAINVDLNVDNAPKGVGAPLRADVVVGVVQPGGRVVRESARVPVRPDDFYVGLKTAHGERRFGRDELVEIDAVLLDWQGNVIDGEVEWKLYQQDYWFDWYRQNGEWRWRRQWRDHLVLEGRGETGRAEIGKLVSQSLANGSYRLEATRAGGSEKTDIAFYVGWRAHAAGVQSPDQAALTLQNDNVTPGARARLVLNAPYEGEAIITVATDRVHQVQRVKVDGGAKEITIDTDPSWGGGFYVLATVVTPRDLSERPVPRRAMGISYVPFGMSARTLNVSFDKPEVFRPRQKLDLPVTIEGAQVGEDVRLTLAAVDEGILRITKFASPDPKEHYFGKKKLGVEIRDDYGRILNANLGAPTRFGGDQIGGEGLTVVPTKSVVLYSGLITVGDGGAVVVPFDVPDFNGELRLMAVAWSADKVGSQAAPLTVRDPVPVELTLPRFVAPGDKATATLLIDNVDGEAGEYEVSIAGEGPIRFSETASFTLAEGQRETALFTFETGEVGIGAVNLTVSGPNGFEAARSYPIQSRTPYFPITQVETAAFAPEEEYRVSGDVLQSFVPGSGEASVSFSRIRGIETGALLDALYGYPYGCTEQLTSSAMPLLFVDVLGGEVGRGPERAVRPRVQNAVNKILDRQGADGGFGLWRVGDGYASAWLAPYVTDFLYRADAEGYSVPDASLDAAYGVLKRFARLERWYAASYQARALEGAGDTTNNLQRRTTAYAMYVLARAGRADLSDLRYFHDNLMEQAPSPLARAHIGAALAMMGDRARSISAFEQAAAALGWNNRGDYYQSNLRDAAGVVALAVEAGLDDQSEAYVDKMMSYMKDARSMNTQEKAYLLLAAQALIRKGGEVELSMNGDRLVGIAPAPSFTPTLDALNAGVEWRNEGEGRIYRSLSLSGSPLTAPGAASNGITVTKRLATRAGAAVDPSTIKQNDRLVVVLSGKANDQRLHPVVIADLLPAGFEIETILSPEDAAGQGRSQGPYRWIGELSKTNVAEARDDRFVAAIDLFRGRRFTIAYIVRAVTPGEYAAPGVVVEDMYRPEVNARSLGGKVTIAPAAQ